MFDIPKSKLFLSYSHVDESYQKQLVAHLIALERTNRIACWHDRKIMPGENWSESIKKEIRETDIFLMLISADFIASDYCYGIELKEAMNRNSSGRSILLPIIIRPVMLTGSPFENIEALPEKGKAVSEWGNVDVAWKNVTEGILQSIISIENRKRRFLEKLIPESVFEFYKKREGLIILDELSAVARNIKRLKTTNPDIWQALEAHIQKLSSSLKQTWDHIWNLYEIIWIGRMSMEGYSAPDLDNFSEHIMKLSTEELKIHEMLDKNNLKPNLFGLQSISSTMEDMQSSMDLMKTSLERTQAFISDVKEIGQFFSSVSNRNTSTEFEEP